MPTYALSIIATSVSIAHMVLYFVTQVTLLDETELAKYNITRNGMHAPISTQRIVASSERYLPILGSLRKRKIIRSPMIFSKCSC